MRVPALTRMDRKNGRMPLAGCISLSRTVSSTPSTEEVAMPPRRAVTGRSQEPRQRYAEELRLLRAQKGDTLRQLGDVLGWDWSLFGKMEKGETLGGPEVAQALDQHYGTSGLLLTLWELAAGDPTQFKERYRRYMTLEPRQWGCGSTPWQATGTTSDGRICPRCSPWRVAQGRRADQQVDARIGRREVAGWGMARPHSAPSSPRPCCVLVARCTMRGGSSWSTWRSGRTPNVALQILPSALGLTA